MKNISVYLRNHVDGPSCYYRVVQFIEHIDNACFKINDALDVRDFRRNMDEKNGVLKRMLQFVLLLKICIRRYMQIKKDLKKRPDAIIIQREVFPRVLPKFFVRKYRTLLSQTTVIWDFDDSILSCGEISKMEWSLLSKHSDKVIATSNYLLGFVQTDESKKIALPTTDGFCDCIDLDAVHAKRAKTFSNAVKLVWVGTHSNLKNIVKILPRLNNAGTFLKQNGKDLELEIVCNVDAPELNAKYEGLKIKFTYWTREHAQNAILNAHVGLMPLPDDEFSKGKGGFKLVQYIASGIPVVGSKVGFNKEIVTKEIGSLVNDESDWSDIVVCLGLNFTKWEEKCSFARARYVDNFSFKSNLDVWKKTIFEKALENA